jgi:pimeloyl-ACP methyl ester carboxylesterase
MDFNSTGRLAANERPIYVYHGLGDETAPPSHAELYAHAIPQAHVYLLPGRDHQLNSELREIAAMIQALVTAGKGTNSWRL